MNDKTKTVLGFFALILILSPIYCMVQNRKNIEKCHKITIGIVTGFNDSKPFHGIMYEYYIDQKRYVNSANYNCELPKSTKVPVIYSCSDEDNSGLLLLPEDFHKYNMEYPDSLKWLEKYINRHQFKKIF